MILRHTRLLVKRLCHVGLEDGDPGETHLVSRSRSCLAPDGTAGRQRKHTYRICSPLFDTQRMCESRYSQQSLNEARSAEFRGGLRAGCAHKANQPTKTHKCCVSNVLRCYWARPEHRSPLPYKASLPPLCGQVRSRAHKRGTHFLLFPVFTIRLPKRTLTLMPLHVDSPFLRHVSGCSIAPSSSSAHALPPPTSLYTQACRACAISFPQTRTPP